MNKVSILIAFLLLGVSAVTAQNFKVEKSSEFKAPINGWNKVFQAKNGNTLLFKTEIKPGIFVTVYDKSRKEISSQVLKSDNWDDFGTSETRVCGMYEINGEVVIFFYQFKQDPVLYRIRVSTQTGAIMKEDAIGKLDMPNLGWRMTMKNIISSDREYILVEKDPNSDCYAVAICDYDLKSTSMNVSHYDGTHKKLNEAKFVTPSGFKFSVNSSMAVDGNKSVYMMVLAFKKNNFKEECDLYVSRANVGEQVFTSKNIHPDFDFASVNTLLIYNHDSNKLEMLSVSVTKRKHEMLTEKNTKYYATILTMIDPVTLMVTYADQIGVDKINEYGHKHIDEDFSYSGIPRSMILNKDNSITLMLEEMHTLETQSTTKTYFGSAGISELSSDGKEVRGFPLIKKQEAWVAVPVLYISYRNKGGYLYDHSDMSLMSFDYIKTTKWSYVIFNDIPSNNLKEENEKKRQTMSNESDCNTIVYKLNDNSLERLFPSMQP